MLLIPFSICSSRIFGSVRSILNQISSASSLPLIAVGPGWTKTKVIKAVKYGVDDILLTPASDAEIEEKIDSVSAQIAA